MMSFPPGFAVFTGGPFSTLDIDDRRITSDATGWAKAPTAQSVESAHQTFPSRIQICGVAAAVPTAQRPTAAHGLFPGCSIFDTTLNLPVFWDGSAWRNAAGAVV